jgi:integrase
VPARAREGNHGRSAENGRPRTGPAGCSFTPELRGLLEAQRAHTTVVSSKRGRIIATVFHRDGLPIKSFRRAWRSACKDAGWPWRIFHDFRRTAIRNLERAGVPRSVAMQMVGHKTEAICRRYAIVNDADLHAAAVKLAAMRRRNPRWAQ